MKHAEWLASISIYIEETEAGHLYGDDVAIADHFVECRARGGSFVFSDAKGAWTVLEKGGKLAEKERNLAAALIIYTAIPEDSIFFAVSVHIKAVFNRTNSRQIW